MALEAVCSDYLAESIIDILTVDELLKIFYFLSLYDRLMAMRVCKKWNHILRDKRAWTFIDFHEECRAPRKGSLHFTWKFPSTETDMLNFLHLYAGGTLKAIYLSVITKGLINYLRTHCPNLKTISQLPTGFHDCKDYKVGNGRVKDMFYFPSGVRRCELDSPLMPSDGSEIMYDWEKQRRSRDVEIFRHLSQLKHLRSLKLRAFSLSTAALQTLTKKTKTLEEMQIIQPFVVTQNDENLKFDDMLASTVGTLTTLKCLRIEWHSVYDDIVLRNLPKCIAEWKQLKALAFRGVCVTDDAFVSMIPALLNLESLELEDGPVTTTIVSLAGKNLKKLKYLEIGNGRYSNVSLKAFLNHPALEKVWIHQNCSFQTSVHSSWLHTIFDILVTLPKIRHAKLEGYRLQHLHAHESFPVIEGAVIDIKNTVEKPPNVTYILTS